MKDKHLLRRKLIGVCLALLLLSGWDGIWYLTAFPGAWASAQAGNATAASDDAERLRITLDVLESNAVKLREIYEAKRDCRILRQGQDIAEALLVLAEAGSESYRRGKDEWDRINRLIPQCSTAGSILHDRSVSGTTTRDVVIRGGGGCTNGLVAELLGQNGAFIQDYAERAGIEMDLAAIANAERILLDVTPADRSMGSEVPYATIQAKCDPKSPGVKGMSEAILSYFLMTEQQRNSWLPDIPQPFRNIVPGLPLGTPTPWKMGPFVPNPTRRASWPEFTTPFPSARVTPPPIRILPPP